MTQGDVNVALMEAVAGLERLTRMTRGRLGFSSDAEHASAPRRHTRAEELALRRSVEQLELSGDPGVVDSNLTAAIAAAAPAFDLSSIVVPSYFPCKVGSLTLAAPLPLWTVGWCLDGTGVTLIGLLRQRNSGGTWETNGVFLDRAFGLPWEQEGEDLADAKSLVQAMGATMAITSQRLARLDRHQPPRSVRRQWDRSASEERRILVYRLRRLSAGRYNSEQSDREYHHRWWVSGHWRSLPPSEQNREPREVWVTPHVKGPVGTPFLPPSRRLIVANR